MSGAFRLGRIFDVCIVAGDISIGRYVARLIAPYFLPENRSEALRSQPPALGRWLSLVCLLAVVLYVLGLWLYLEPLKKLSRKKATAADYAAAAFNSCLLGIVAFLVVIELANWEGEGFLWPLLATVLGFFTAGGVWFALHVRALSHLGKAAAAAEASERKRYGKKILAGLALMLPFIFLTLAPVDLLAEGMSFKYGEVAVLKWTLIDVGLAVAMRSALLALLAWWIVYLPRKLAGASLGAQLQGWKFFSAFFVGYAAHMVIELVRSST